MYGVRKFILLKTIVLFLVFSACSFNYEGDSRLLNIIPDMLMQEASVDRYENAEISLTFNAEQLEMYDSDRIWAAENVSFTQFADDGTGSIEAEGSAGLLLVDDSAEVYSLGNDVSFRMVSENLYVKAQNLRWSKKIARLSSSQSEVVEIGKDDGTTIRGTGFFADTLSQTYDFSQSVSGQIVKKDTAIPPSGSEDIIAENAADGI